MATKLIQSGRTVGRMMRKKARDSSSGGKSKHPNKNHSFSSGAIPKHYEDRFPCGKYFSATTGVCVD